MPGEAPSGDASAPEEELVRRASLGDRAAFAEIFHRHASAMFRYAVHMLDGDAHEAEDAVQSALLKAWQQLPGFQGKSRLQTWLFRITANEALARRRTRRPRPVSDDLLSGYPADWRSSPTTQAAQRELWEALELALTELPWRQRASWLLREMEGLSYGEIADVLGTTETVVRGQLHRARRTLAVRMSQWQ